MQEQIIQELKKITAEEQSILDGREMDRSLYQSRDRQLQDAGKYEIDASLLLEQGKLITIRKHTRFLHFPPHTHNYVEVVYMCSGSTRHMIGGVEVLLKAGELLFLNQNSVQEIFPAGVDDIAVNFIILPEFFDFALCMLDSGENRLRSFVMDCMTGANQESSFLHFKVADVLPVQNLVENLIWTLMNHIPNKRSMNQITMGLLLLQLLNHVDDLETDGKQDGQKLTLTVLSFIEENYRDGKLQDLAGELHYDFFWLSREIKRRTGQTFTELVQAKRLEQAGYLLSHTSMAVSDVAQAVGYENVSYFHRLFRQKYDCSPKHYRDMCK